MNKLFLTIALALVTTIASAQFSVLTTVNKVEGIDAVEPNTCEVYDGEVCPTTETDDSWNITDKIGIGYQVNEKLMVGITKDGEDAYELLGRYMIKDMLWATCIYNHVKDSEDEMMDKLDLGLGYSFNVWKNLYVDPYFVMPMKENEEGEREGSFNLGLSYKF
tara:strand:- start:2929 stop:3417 length:489 start_codon:yes stop_codon:yes gene_type:complete